MEFGIMFFSSVEQRQSEGRYRLLIEASRFADREAFCGVWTPERHFHPFGGLFPDPAVVSAALAMITENIQIRAGSLISPLHDTIRIAESWSVVDNLSGGRVAISFGSGWNSEDFVFYPENHSQRQAVMYRQIRDVQAIWSGEKVRRTVSDGREIEVAIYPRPVQAELPVWVTSSGNVKTFTSAGEIGANVLTHLIGQTVDELAEKIRSYRQAREQFGFDPSSAKVTLMLHTFLGTDVETVKEQVREPFTSYLKSAISLEQVAARGAGIISGGHKIDPHDIPEQDMEDLLEITFENYFHNASLIGTKESRRELVGKLEEIGVDEIACLIDFLPDYDMIMESLELLAEFRREFGQQVSEQTAQRAVDAFMEDL